MKKLLLVLVIAAIVAGCTTTQEVKTGQSKAYIGEVRVEKAMAHIGPIVTDSWVIQADENGNAIISAGKGAIELIPFYLSNSARAEYTSHLKKLIELGNIFADEKIEARKNLGHILAKTIFSGGSVIIRTSFIPIGEGNSWFGKIHFCELQSTDDMMAKSRPINNDPCVKKSDFYLLPDSVVQLVKCLDRVSEYSTKTSVSKSKSDLLK